MKDQGRQLIGAAVVGLAIIASAQAPAEFRTVAYLIAAVASVLAVFWVSAGGDREAEEKLRELKERLARVAEAEQAAEELSDRLMEQARSQREHVRDTNRVMSDLLDTWKELATRIDALSQGAEDSSSSVLEITTTSDAVAENVAGLSSSVRETVSAIEEMAASIREAAKNIDALSLTAEETSSAMNEMDVSIDQVQSNANETARLSEEVTLDAERGAEALTKTIEEINRIRGGSQEAVTAISLLGSRIEAIGEIVNVIDDVAEQTNLLALNAAIIAAQAGEQGKGFAVVADEIKDLAERAGSSTREITELIRTIQAESKNAIVAVERGAQNVDRGVSVSNEAERALKKIVDSSQKSTNMVRAIARATVEQARGSKQVTDSIGRIAETVQQIATATSQQARGSDAIMRSAEKMRTITAHVERSAQEQARGGRQVSLAMERISTMVTAIDGEQKRRAGDTSRVTAQAKQLDEGQQAQEEQLKRLDAALGKLRRALGT